MSISEFRDNDRGSLEWTASNPDGFVPNIARSLNPSDARLHRANCRTITGDPARGRTWTGPYLKYCAPTLAELEQWAGTHAGHRVDACRICLPG